MCEAWDVRCGRVGCGVWCVGCGEREVRCMSGVGWGRRWGAWCSSPPHTMRSALVPRGSGIFVNSGGAAAIVAGRGGEEMVVATPTSLPALSRVHAAKLACGFSSVGVVTAGGEVVWWENNSMQGLELPVVGEGPQSAR